MKPIKPLSALFFCFFGFQSLASNISQNTDYYEKALESFYLSDLKSAEIHLKNALQIAPEHLPSRVLMAEILIAMGNGAVAEVELDYAIKNGADDTKILPLIVEAYLLQNKYKEVFEIIKPAQRTKHQQSQLDTFKGQAYVGQSKFVLAKQSYLQALENNPNNHQATLGLAQVAILSNEHDKAQQHLITLLSKEPNNHGALLMLGNLYSGQGKNKEALAKIDQLLAMQPKHFPALLTRAGILIDQEQLDSALADLDIILTDAPNEPRANYLKLIITSLQGKQEQSEEIVKHLTLVFDGLPEDVKNNNPIYYYLAGLVAFQQGLLDKSEDALRKYNKINERDVRAIKLLGEINFLKNELFAAKTYLVKARLLSPEDIEIWKLLADTYLTLGELKKAENYYQDVIGARPKQLAPLLDLANYQLVAGLSKQALVTLNQAEQLPQSKNSPELLMAMTNAYQAEGQYTLALEKIESLLSLNKTGYLIQRKGSLLGMNGDPEQARAAYEQALVIEPDNIEAIVHLARMDVLSDQIEPAITRLENAHKKYSDNTLLAVELGDAYRAQGNEDNALSWYEKAYDADRDSDIALTKVSELLLQQGKIKETIVYIEEYLSRQPNAANMHLLIARIYLANKQSKQAFDSFQLAVQKANDKSTMLMEFAYAYMEVKDYVSAASQLEKAIAWNADNLDAYFLLIDVLQQLEQFEQAKQQITRLAKVYDNKAVILSLEADSYRLSGQYSRAEQQYLLALQEAPIQSANLGLYRVYIAGKKYPQAIRLMKKWMKNNPDDLISAIALADAYRDAKQLKAASDYYKTLIERYPNAPVLLNNAAQISILQGDLNSASDYAEKAYYYLPSNINIVDTKAWVDCLLDRCEKALPLFREALVADSENAEIKYHLAYALNKLGRRGEALKQLTESVESERDFREKPNAKKLLAEWKSR